MSNTKKRRGIVVGKFYPPHAGHHYLIRTALANCDELTVWIAESHRWRDLNGGFDIPAEKRLEWLTSIHPDANIGILDQDDHGLPDADSQKWADVTVELLGYTPDVVFSSEDYGKTWADLMGCEHFLVDFDRTTFPISATQVRENPQASFAYLHPIVRAAFIPRICLVGTESTGKTTLARALAAEYQTAWVPEYGRVYHELGRVGRGLHAKWEPQELYHIAQMQNELEDHVAEAAPNVLICDTNAFVTQQWHERLVGAPDTEYQKWVDHTRYDLYILTDAHTPFTQDKLGLREEGLVRDKMHARMREELQAAGVSYIAVAGTHEQRMAQATEAIDKLIGRKKPI